MRRVSSLLSAVVSAFALTFASPAPTRASPAWADIIGADVYGGKKNPGAMPQPQGCSTFTGASTIGLDDGCAGSPHLSQFGYQNPNMLKPPGTPGSIYQSGQKVSRTLHADVTSPVDWNVAGLDFPVGPNDVQFCATINDPDLPCATDENGVAEKLIDASRYDWARDPAHTGCAQASYNRSLPEKAYFQVYCVIQDNTEIHASGFDFSPAEAVTATPGNEARPTVCTVGGCHRTCVGLYIRDQASITTPKDIYVEDNYVNWTGDTSCFIMWAAQRGLLGWAGSLARNQSGGTTNIPFDIDSRPTTPRWVHINRNSTLMNGDLSYNEAGQPMWFGWGNAYNIAGAMIAGQNRFGLEVKYNYARAPVARWVGGNIPCAGQLINFNVIADYGLSHADSTHGELTYITSGMHNGANDSQCPPFPQGVTTLAPSDQNYGWGSAGPSELIGNVAWTSSVNAGPVETFFLYGHLWSAPGLLSWSLGEFSLNTFVSNRPGAGNSRTGWHFNVNVLGPGYDTTNGLGGYSAGAQQWAMFDILTVENPNCTSKPTMIVRTGPTPFMSPGFNGACSNVEVQPVNNQSRAITASLSGNALAVTAGRVSVGDYIYGGAMPAQTYVLSGRAPNFVVNTSGTVALARFTANSTYHLTCRVCANGFQGDTGWIISASSLGGMSNNSVSKTLEITANSSGQNRTITASLSGDQLTVTAGTVYVGDTITGTNVPANTYVVSGSALNFSVRTSTPVRGNRPPAARRARSVASSSLTVNTPRDAGFENYEVLNIRKNNFDASGSMLPNQPLVTLPTGNGAQLACLPHSLVSGSPSGQTYPALRVPFFNIGNGNSNVVSGANVNISGNVKPDGTSFGKGDQHRGIGGGSGTDNWTGYPYVNGFAGGNGC
jgi:hypothetical protein